MSKRQLVDPPNSIDLQPMFRLALFKTHSNACMFAPLFCWFGYCTFACVWRCKAAYQQTLDILMRLELRRIEPSTSASPRRSVARYHCATALSFTCGSAHQVMMQNPYPNQTRPRRLFVWLKVGQFPLPPLSNGTKPTPNVCRQVCV